MGTKKTPLFQGSGTKIKMKSMMYMGGKITNTRAEFVWAERARSKLVQEKTDVRSKALVVADATSKNTTGARPTGMQRLLGGLIQKAGEAGQRGAKQ